MKALLAFAFLATACTTAAQPQRWTGAYVFHFETSAFHPDGSEEQWWVASANAEAASQLRAALHTDAAGPPWGEARVTLEGNLSAPGRWGHLGAYAHELSVTRVIAASPPPADN